MNVPSVQDLMKAGVHFGHQASRWHPKMEPFIFGVKNDVHIINLEKTQEQLKKIINFIDSIYEKGGEVLFVGTKKQVAPIIKEQAARVGAPFLSEHWIGGFITNFSVVIRQTRKFKDLIKQRDTGVLSKYTKKEQAQFEKEIKKLEDRIGGARDITKIPDAIFVWDVKSEKTAIKEAKEKGVPIIGVCDTNANPKGIDYILPANDDGTKSISLLITFIADVVAEAKKKAPKPKEEKSEPSKLVKKMPKKKPKSKKKK